jgi:Fic family protein
MNYNPNFLDYKPIFTLKETELLEDVNRTISLDEFMKNRNLVEKFGFDFVYTSAKIEGNTYSKADALTLLDYGKTAGGKDFDDAKMLINLNRAFKYILDDECIINQYKIREIHSILSDELVSDDECGSVRKKGVLIKGSDYIPLSDAITLQSELERMISIYHTIENQYDKALYIHNNLAYLQYFADVNKRTARTVLNLSLICNDKMLLIPQEELIGLYIEGILQYYENGSSENLKKFFIQSYIKTQQEVREVNS